MTSPDAAGAPTPGAPDPRSRNAVRRVVLVVLVLVALGGLVVAGQRTVRNGGADDVTISGGDGAVEALIPGREAETLSQTEIGIDLAPGWTGELSLNGEPITDVQRVDALNQLLYRPPDGLESGRNCVTARIWRSSESSDSGRDVRWCFEVT
ncbi:MAG: hypothetical protein KDB35_02135 [Acidimicrobiales bacterium]|nr:hypothetical protein [Acidimicrobiales bacterium]MCB1016188.1 hypothetical protein [Acidimicrobiales bacterium]MCB9372716.1 hypothetical protein [Microthrixaceae bacterium]